LFRQNGSSQQGCGIFFFPPNFVIQNIMDGIDNTFQTLAHTKNRMVAVLLEQALESSNETVRKMAGRQLLLTKGIEGAWILIRKFDSTDSNLIEIIEENRERIIPA
jgi:hypothetical protein